MSKGSSWSLEVGFQLELVILTMCSNLQKLYGKKGNTSLMTQDRLNIDNVELSSLTMEKDFWIKDDSGFFKCNGIEY